MTKFFDYWKVERSVFLRPVEPSDLFLTEGLRADLDRLILLTRQPQILTLVTGSKGTGKSSILKWIHGNMPVSTHETLLTTMISSEKTPGWLTPRLGEFFGVPLPVAAGDNQLRSVVAQFDELIDEKRNLVVMIDAAHLGETTAAWQEVTGLMSLQALAGACVSFVLCGEPFIRELFATTPELATAMSFAIEIPPLTAESTSSYITHRLRLADITAEFTPESTALIFATTRGIIAKINALAENCLMECCHLGTRVVTPEIVGAVSRYIGGKQPSSNPILVGPGSLTTPLTAIYKPTPPKSSTQPGTQSPLTASDDQTQAQQAAVTQKDAASVDPPAQDAAGIKLASLFKSEATRRRQ
jgi:energy-coupling factor transporter ATP-binding protein EcfA2